MQLGSGANVTPFPALSRDPLLLPLTELFLIIPVGCTPSMRWRLLRLAEGGMVPVLETLLERWFKMAAGGTIPAGGVLPIRMYSCSISCF